MHYTSNYTSNPVICTGDVIKVVFIKLDKQADDSPLKALNIHPSLEGGRL
jgi:hypothetical protein